MVVIRVFLYRCFISLSQVRVLQPSFQCAQWGIGRLKHVEDLFVVQPEETNFVSCFRERRFFSITQLLSCLHGTDHLQCSGMQKTQKSTTFSVGQLTAQDRWLGKLLQSVQFVFWQESTERSNQFRFENPKLVSSTFSVIYWEKQKLSCLGTTFESSKSTVPFGKTSRSL